MKKILGGFLILVGMIPLVFMLLSFLKIVFIIGVSLGLLFCGIKFMIQKEL